MLKKLKIVLHVLNSNSFSGAEKVVIDIIKNLNDNSIKCIYVSRKGDIENRLIKEHVPYILLDTMNTRSIKEVINQIHPDLVHCHDFRASMMVALSGTKVPLISHIHQNPSWIKKVNVKTLLYLMTLNRYNCVISVSKSFFDEYIFSNQVKNKVVLSNIIDLKKIQLNRKVVKERVYDIVYVGRLSQEKNPMRVLKIVLKLKRNFPNIRCAIVGNGNLYQECEKFIKDYELGENVQLVGFLDDISDVLNKAKIGINTSLWEGFGLSVVEYLAFGLPVVCSSVGGLVDLVNDSCGKLCFNDDDFIDEITLLLSDLDYYSKKSLSAINRASDLNNVDEYVNKVKKIYFELIGGE